MADRQTFLVSGMYVINNCLVVPVKEEVDDNYIKGLGKAILEQVETTGIRGVLINVSAIKILDSYSFSILRDIAKAIALLGANSVFVGFQPGVASSLVDFDIGLEGICTVITLDDGFEILNPPVTDPEQPEGTDCKTPESEFSDPEQSEANTDE